MATLVAAWPCAVFVVAAAWPAELTLELSVLDDNGSEIYRKLVTGHYQNEAALVISGDGAE